jgi:6-O-methylguanine DNA methyltransferase, DNA binding domain
MMQFELWDDPTPQPKQAIWDCDDEQCVWCNKPELREKAALQTNLGWADEAWRYVNQLPTGKVFTADDVTEAVGQADSPGAVGALFRQLSTKKLIEFHGYTKTRRITSHGRDLKEWIRA